MKLGEAVEKGGFYGPWKLMPWQQRALLKRNGTAERRRFLQGSFLEKRAAKGEPAVISEEVAETELVEILVSPPVADILRHGSGAGPDVPKTTARHAREPQELTNSPQATGAWILLTLILCTLFVYAFQRIQNSDAAMQRLGGELKTSKTERDRLQRRATEASAMNQANLSALNLKLNELTAKLEKALRELKIANEETAGREKELQELILFLRGELQANDEQISFLKKALAEKTEIRKAK